MKDSLGLERSQNSDCAFQGPGRDSIERRVENLGKDLCRLSCLKGSNGKRKL